MVYLAQFHRCGALLLRLGPDPVLALYYPGGLLGDGLDRGACRKKEDPGGINACFCVYLTVMAL